MRNYEIVWNTARATYDLFVDNEWYAEDRNYERLDDMMRSMRQCELEMEDARFSPCPDDYYGDCGDELIDEYGY